MAGRLCVTTLVCCCLLLAGGINGVKVKDHLHQRQSKTYADFLHGVSAKVEHYNDPKHIEMIESLSYQMYELYSPMGMYLSKNKRNVVDKELSDNVKIMTIPLKDTLESGGDDIHRDTKPDVLHAILTTLQKSPFNQNTTSTCINDIGRIITGLQTHQKWTFQFFDATGKPGPSLLQLHLDFVGNYDQCRASAAPPDLVEKRQGFKGSYFRITFVTSIPRVISQLGMCLPNTCTSAEISSLVHEMVVGKGFKNISITNAYAEKLDAPTEMTTVTIAAIAILSTIGFLMVVGTFIDVVVIKSWMQEEDNLRALVDVNDQSNGYSNASYDEVNNRTNDVNRNNSPPINNNDDSAPLIYSLRNSNLNTYTRRTFRFKFNPSNIVVKIFLAFSVYSNGKKLLNTKQSAGSLGAVHGIRFISMSWVVLCHWYVFSVTFTYNAYTEFPILTKRWSFLPILNGYASVDTFFTLSGLLTSYITIKEMNRRETAKINWFMFYFHRFWRLTPPYMLSMLTVLAFSQYLGQGPLWNNLQPGDKVACEKNWWTNLLYINNLVNADEACFGHSWYLANDMQFFILSPLMLLPLYFSKLLGLISCLVFLLATWITTGVLSMIHKWPTNTISLHPIPDRAPEVEWFYHYYIVPWCRIGPFVIGIMAGYVLALTKGRQFRMRWWVVALGWVVSITSGLAVVYGLRGDILGDDPSSLRTAAIYNAVSRSAWGACVCWVVIACSAGYGGPINTLLSWSPFVVLGRLTYLVYLIHLCIGGVFFQNLGALIYVNDTTMVATFLGVFTVINMVAFVAVLALESPMLALEKVFFKRNGGS